MLSRAPCVQDDRVNHDRGRMRRHRGIAHLCAERKRGVARYMRSMPGPACAGRPDAFGARSCPPHRSRRTDAARGRRALRRGDRRARERRRRLRCARSRRGAPRRRRSAPRVDAAARPAGRVQGHFRHRRFADAIRLADLCRLSAARRRHRGGADAARRRHRHRQDGDHRIGLAGAVARRAIRTIARIRRAARRRARPPPSPPAWCRSRSARRPRVR